MIRNRFMEMNAPQDSSSVSKLVFVLLFEINLVSSLGIKILEGVSIVLYVVS